MVHPFRPYAVLGIAQYNRGDSDAEACRERVKRSALAVIGRNSASASISLTLIDEGEGWRFATWERRTKPLPPPEGHHCERRFESIAEAAGYFRALCPREGAVGN
jgi:hypothetical protein